MQLPSGYRFTLKRGMRGWDVRALQINLKRFIWSVVVDADYGALTEEAVAKFQERSNGVLVVDGIAGLRTQQSLALQLATKPQADYKLPPGVLRGITEGESGWAVGAVNASVAGGIDCGYLQQRVYEREYSEEAFAQAFDGGIQYPRTAKKLRDQKNSFYGQPGATTHRRAWELAVLYHNWPYAAERLAAGKCIYTDCTRDTAEAGWVVNIGIPGVTTPREWTEHYISSKLAYVKSWPE